MAGIDQSTLFAITQVRTTFADDIGNKPTTGDGTGFFLRTASNVVAFVTNRHNLDPTLNPGAKKRLGPTTKLTHVALLLRRMERLQPTAETAFVEVDLPNTRVKHSADADVSILVSPKFLTLPDGYGYMCIRSDEMVSPEMLGTDVSMADIVTFIGYPSQDGKPWWDTQWNTAIGRLAGIASRTDFSFANEQIPTRDVTLVSGLSFRGSSGSPVILHEKPAPPVGSKGRHMPAKVLGIMSGHWWEETDEPAMFRHSGLSYFTRVTAIQALLNGI